MAGLDDAPCRRASAEAVCAGPIAENDRGDNNRKGDNLLPLGAVLYEVFVGKQVIHDGSGIGTISTSDQALDDFSSSTDAPMKKREKRSRNSSSPRITMNNLGLPIFLCDLVTNLLDSSGSYLSFNEVEDDLRFMASDPDRFLSDADPGAHAGRLQLPHDRLYGRDAHLSMLAEAYERFMGSSKAHEIVLVSGNSGTGKTCLVRQAQSRFVAKGAYFASGKFDETCQARPLSAIVAAFNEYCNILLRGNEDVVSDIRGSIEAAIGCDSKVLTDLIPSLSEVIGEPSSSSAVVGGKEAHNRFRLIFRKFVRAIATPCHPVVLFLDDLQWADEASLDLVQFFVTDSDSTSLLFVGTYRDDEVGPEHPLTAQLQSMKEAGVKCSDIKVESMDQESVNALISDTLRVLPRLTRPLADAVYMKTNGNALSVIQFIRSLVDEGFLLFSLNSRRWEWDFDSIHSKPVASNVVKVMTQKMLKLPQEVQYGLKVASCFGSSCTESTLQLLEGFRSDACGNVLGSLAIAVSEGLMVKIPGALYSFSHDQIQNAAYSLIPESDREAMHLEIGRHIIQNREQEAKTTDSLIFEAADQLNRGKKLITDHDERIEIVSLNLEAGKKAIASSAFLTSSIYLLEGLQLVDSNDWEHHYEVSLELFSTCAEVLCVVGDLTAINPTLEMIFKNGRCIQDKFRAYYTLMNSLAAQGRPLAAIDIGLEVLLQLGEDFLTEPNLDEIKDDILSTKNMLEGTTTDGILQKEDMRDRNKTAAMKLLNLMSFYTLTGKPELTELVACRMVRLSLSYGVCRESAYGFANFGVILCASINDVRGGYCFGKLAMLLLERFKAKECLSRVYFAVFGFINNFVEPYQAGLVSLNHGYEIGMLTGDIEGAMMCALLYVGTAFQCGSKLELLVEEVRSKTLQMKEYNQHIMMAITLPCLQAIYNLMSSSGDPTHLTGEAMDQEELPISVLAAQNRKVVFSIYFFRMWLAYLFRKYELAAEMAEKRLELTTSSSGHRIRGPTVVNERFYTGLIAVALARTKGQQKWGLLARNAFRELMGWEQNSTWNFQHKVALLEAEISFLDEDIENAAKAYDKSIHAAGKCGFIHEQALACERAGLFSLELGNMGTAKDYFMRSQKLYLSWGAKRKADDITKQLLDLNET